MIKLERRLAELNARGMLYVLHIVDGETAAAAAALSASQRCDAQQERDGGLIQHVVVE